MATPKTPKTPSPQKPKAPKATPPKAKPRKAAQRRLSLTQRKSVAGQRRGRREAEARPPLEVLGRNLLRPSVQAALAVVFFDLILPGLAVAALAMDELDKQKEREQHPAPEADPAVAAAVGMGKESILGSPWPPTLVVEQRACNCARCSARRQIQGVN